MVRVIVAFVSVCLISGCGGVQLEPQPTRAINFSGAWLIDFGESDSIPDLRHRVKSRVSHRIRGGVNKEAARLVGGSGLAFIVHDFQVLQADKLDIEQSRDSMGVQYHPGVYRDVSWGDRQRGLWEVQAGWQDDELLIISTAKDLRVVEQFSHPSKNRLVVSVNITADGEDMAFTRRFNRQP